jgi:two-component system nitrogen regulation sensor histidine kinase GlnL
MVQDIEFYSQLSEYLTTALMVLDDNLSVIYLNPTAEDLFEISRERAHKLVLASIMQEHPKPLNEIQRALDTGQPFTKHEVLCLLPSGHQFTADYTVSLVPYHDKQYIIIEFLPRDRLSRISNEEQLLAKQNASKLLVRGLAHEIKNPLGGIRGAAQLLSRELSNPSLEEYTQIIIEEADRLRNLVDQMLGPHQTFKQEMTNIHEVLERVRQLIAAEVAGEIHLLRDYDPSIPEFIGDKGQLIQAVLNITRNAMQALKEQNTENHIPQIQFKTRTLRRFTIGQTCHRLVLNVCISDNGPGISSHLIQSIFDPMVSGRAEGTGLGLSITQNIISQHAGLVECQSQPGETCFNILIPLGSSS